MIFKVRNANFSTRGPGKANNYMLPGFFLSVNLYVLCG